MSPRELIAPRWSISHRRASGSSGGRRAPVHRGGLVRRTVWPGGADVVWWGEIEVLDARSPGVATRTTLRDTRREWRRDARVSQLTPRRPAGRSGFDSLALLLTRAASCGPKLGVPSCPARRQDQRRPRLQVAAGSRAAADGPRGHAMPVSEGSDLPLGCRLGRARASWSLV